MESRENVLITRGCIFLHPDRGHGVEGGLCDITKAENKFCAIMRPYYKNSTF